MTGNYVILKNVFFISFDLNDNNGIFSHHNWSIMVLICHQDTIVHLKYNSS